MSETPKVQPPEPRDASTVIVVRESRDEAFEVLLIKRAQRSAFMGGAHVFPGGRIDPADSDPAWNQHLDSADGLGSRLREPELGARAASLFIGAARETLEEAGVLLADCTPETAKEVARQIATGTPFLSAVMDAEVKLSCSSLLPWARWVTPSIEPKRFDTRFFVVRMPEGQEASHDGHEATTSDWLSARQALARHREGTIVLAPPTLRTIEELDAYPTSDALFTAAKHVFRPSFDRSLSKRTECGPCCYLATPNTPRTQQCSRDRRGLFWRMDAGGAAPPELACGAMGSVKLSGWALILGASSGFGEAAALAFAEAGMDIIGVHLDRRAALPHIEEVKTKVAALGRQALYYNVNAADEGKRREVLDDVVSKSQARRFAF